MSCYQQPWWFQEKSWWLNQPKMVNYTNKNSDFFQEHCDLSSSHIDLYKKWFCQNTWILLLNWYESMIWAAKVEDGLSWFIKEAWVVEAIKWLGPFTQQTCGLQPTSTDNSNSLYPKFEGLHTSPRMVWMDGWVKSCLYQWLGLLWKAIFRSKLTNWMVQ
jgi:hypothetical protein